MPFARLHVGLKHRVSPPLQTAPGDGMLWRSWCPPVPSLWVRHEGRVGHDRVVRPRSGRDIPPEQHSEARRGDEILCSLEARSGKK